MDFLLALISNKKNKGENNQEIYGPPAPEYSQDSMPNLSGPAFGGNLANFANTLNLNKLKTDIPNISYKPSMSEQLIDMIYRDYNKNK